MAGQARRRALILVALALAGCGASSGDEISGGGEVIGATVTVYSLTTDPGGAGRDLVDAEKLALADAGGRAGALAVNFSALDLGGADERLQAQAARRAIADGQIIAAIVDATPVTVPLFNAAGLLQVAPGGDTSLTSDPDALPLGRSTVGVPPPDGAPADFAARFRAAFGRDPAPDAERGYRAMRGVLAAIAEAGTAGTDRDRVAEAYLG